MFTRAPIRIDEQADQILRLYGPEIPNENRRWLQQVVNYRKNLFSRIRLAVTRKTKYISFNMGVKIRMQILLGNR